MTEPETGRSLKMYQWINILLSERVEVQIYFIEPDDIQALKDVLLILKEHEYPHMILGNGTNILVKDGGYRGAVIKIGKAFEM